MFYILEYSNFIKVGVSLNPAKRIKDLDLQFGEKRRREKFYNVNDFYGFERRVKNALYSTLEESERYKTEVFCVSFDLAEKFCDWFQSSRDYNDLYCSVQPTLFFSMINNENYMEKINYCFRFFSSCPLVEIEKYKDILAKNLIHLNGRYIDSLYSEVLNLENKLLKLDLM